MNFNRKLILFTAFLLYTQFSIHAQEKYRITFKDKKGTKFNPYSYFCSKAIERRLKNNISLYDSSDFPLSSDYISKVKINVEEITAKSRWFNCIYVNAFNNQIQKLNDYKFIKNIEKVYYSSLPAKKENKFDLDKGDKKILEGQLKIHEYEYFKKNNITGKGVRIAIFDGGYPEVDNSPFFKKIRKNKRIIKTWDFARNKENVYKHLSHGTNVLSCIGGINDTIQTGLATDAEFLLAITEIRREPFSEEENWLEAVEWADKNGADIINSSLGYTYKRYFVRDMDGKTSYVAKAATLAAKKGILVVNSAGNSGSDDWKFIGTPADADSVLSVGGINPFTNYHTSFSSYGPTNDNRMKPNVCAYGHVIAEGKRGLHKTQGTSFSSPLIAGFAACVLQLKPELKCMELFEEIEKSADLYPYFDYAHGYGVPKASYFFKQSSEQKPSFDFVINKDEIKIKIDSSFISKNEENYLYCNLSDEEGAIKKYYVIRVFSEYPFEMNIKENKGLIIKAKYQNYFKTHKIK